ncbi:MAG: hypothetical protein ABL962_02105 [Fimbriimonadaceae bacterium]
MKKLTLILLFATVSGAVLANNVQAQISSHDLNLQGDLFGNQIRIDRTPTGVRIVGVNGTRVNGLPSVHFVSGPLVNVTGQMGAGNDWVHFRSDNNLGDVVLEAGDGHDSIIVTGSQSRANLNLKGEAGADRIAVDDSYALGDITLDGGIGANTLRSYRTRCDENFKAIGGDLNDRMDFGNLVVGGAIEIASDKGNDIIALSGASVGLSALISTDAGADRVTMSSVEAWEDVHVETGDQNDVVGLTNVRAHKNIGVQLGSGDDRLTASSVAALFDAIAIGGAGFDLFANFGFVGGVKTEIVEFE